MSIEKNQDNKGVKTEGEIINAEEGAIEKAASIEAIKKGDKKIELKTAERGEDKDKEIRKLKSEIMNSGNEKNEENKSEKRERKTARFEVKGDAVLVEMDGSLDDEDSGIVNMISIDSEGKTYGDDNLDYEQLGLKLVEAQDALNRLQKKKSKLPSTNKFLETIRKAFSNEYIINSEINKMMIAKATRGIGRLEKRVEYLEGGISKELS